MNIKEEIRKINSGLSTKNLNLINEGSKIIYENLDIAVEEIKNHYNAMYDPDNGGSGVTTYLKESLIREIVQNIIDCNYNNENIIIDIFFNDCEKYITFNYNEDGFRLEDIISFFSMNHTSKDSNNTGAFGVGAKGAMLSAKKVKVESIYNGEFPFIFNTEIEVAEISRIKTIKINSLVLSKTIGNEKVGTTFTIYLDDNIYNEVKSNLISLDNSSKKGNYITPIDLMFAAIKKPDKKIKLNISNCAYEIYFSKKESKVFFKNGLNKGASLSVYKGENSDFTYLLPQTRYGNDMPIFIKKWNYNLFSTYELTGKIQNEELPRFFINIPTTDKEFEEDKDRKFYITNDRKGIQENKRSRVERFIAEDVKKIIEINSRNKAFYFDCEENSSYILSYLYDFISYKQKTNNENRIWDERFNELCQNIYIEHNNAYYKLVDFKCYEQSAKTTEIDGLFIFTEQSYQQKSTYSKYYDFHRSFEFIVNRELITIRSENKSYEGGYTYYPELRMIIKILSQLPVRNKSEINLLSAENDENFTEETLKKLIDAIESNKHIPRNYDYDNKILTVGQKGYKFDENFELKSINLVYRASIVGSETQNDKDRPKGKLLQDLLLCIFKNTLFKKTDRNNVLECIKLYKHYKDASNNLSNLLFSYDEKNDTQLNISFRNINIERIDTSIIDYEELVKITDLSNNKWFNGKNFYDYFKNYDQTIVDLYDFDCEKLCNIIEKDIDEVTDLFNRFVYAETQYNLGEKDFVALVKDGVIKDILDITNITRKLEYKNLDLIVFLPKKNNVGKHSKLSINKIAKFLDFQFDTGNMISNIYKKTSSPIIKMLDQIPFSFKPIIGVTKSEFDVLKDFYDNKMYSNKSNKMYYAKDLSNRLYGYSTSCSICGYNTNILNAFMLNENIKYIYNNGKEYRLTLYLCANHYFESESFSIIKVTFGKEQKSFPEWLETIKSEGFISADYMKCKLCISKKYIYKEFELCNESDEYESLAFKTETFDITLTPLMAIRWYCDNI